MAGDEEAEDFLFGGEALMLVPVGSVGQGFLGGSTNFFGENSEQAVLTHGGIALRFLRVLHGGVDDGHELRAAAQRVHGSGLDQRLDDTLVEQAKVNLLAELIKRLELAGFFAA